MGKPVIHNENASSLSIPSRDPDRTIPCRVMRPSPEKWSSSSSTPNSPQGVFYHIHGGGWVLMDERFFDPLLKRIADDHNLIVVSIGYRKAPEHPYPAGPNDCYDVAEWLINSSEKEFGEGAALKFIGGESAGAHLSLLVALHLLQHENPTYRSFMFKGLVLNYGAYDLSWLPSSRHLDKEPPLVLNLDLMESFVNAFLPGWSLADRRKPEVSPLYTDLAALVGQGEGGKKLPPALFTCGTDDCLLDDTLFMSVKWAATGAESITRLYPGAPHGFVTLDALSTAKECHADIRRFIDSKL
jgi:acetyl esterase/lipase